MALRKDVHSASTLLSGLSFMLQHQNSKEGLEALEQEQTNGTLLHEHTHTHSGNHPAKPKACLQELQQALCNVDAKTEPGSESELPDAKRMKKVPGLLMLIVAVGRCFCYPSACPLYRSNRNLVQTRLRLDRCQALPRPPLVQRKTFCASDYTRVYLPGMTSFAHITPQLLQDLQAQLKEMKALLTQQQEVIQMLRQARPRASGALSPAASVRSRSHTPGPVTPAPKVTKRDRSPAPAPVPPLTAKNSDEYPRVLDGKNLSRTEKQKCRRVCMPKEGSGTLEVPTNVMEMWEAAGTQRDSLFSMWAKCGGVKAVFIERVVVMSKKTRSKKLVVKGGFYSKEDMKTELGYGAPCEYDSDTMEYWVNTRTEGTLTKEDIDEITTQKEYEGDGGTDLEMKPLVQMGSTPDLDPADPMLGMAQDLEGDTHKPVACYNYKAGRCICSAVVT
ncbi:unnamed protein product [Symbiodinium microadriaticum]|nr:unnamed protein product [Symbiodinium microadriaticum]